MKKLAVCLFCMCLIFVGFSKAVSAEELIKTPLTQSEVTILAQGDIGAVDHIVAGKVNETARTITMVVLSVVVIGLLISTVAQASAL